MKRPYELLPIPFPEQYDPGPDYFHSVAEQFIPDMIQMMDEGLHIDADAVEDLRTTVYDTLASVDTRLAENPIIQEFQKKRQKVVQKQHEEKSLQAIRTPADYLKPFKDSNVTHRTWVVNTYLTKRGKVNDLRDKWTLKDVKMYNIFLKSPFLTKLLEKLITPTDPMAEAGMKALAEYQAELWNRPRQEKAQQHVDAPPFNPGSNNQVAEFFAYLGIQSTEFSKKTGNPSWGREQIEEVLYSTEDETLKEVLNAFVDYSYGAIIRSNFLKAFDTFTIDGVLHGNIKLFGAKSFRNTSNSPNLLNMPSTASVYAKPLKRCFKAKDGFVIYTADLSALEDRVIANLSGDTNKCNIFLEGLDGHSLNACGYFTKLIEPMLNLQYSDDATAFVKAFMRRVEEKESFFTDLRQKSKAPTFKLAYGGYPDDHKGGVITPEIFDNYHKVLYPGITEYREQYVQRTARKQGYIHLGLGCRLYTDDAEGDIRTLNNATVQFWSILTLIAINELNHRIREEGLTNDVMVQSTIYDSIYTQTRRDPEIIKWVNDNMIELMCVQYLEEQIIPNDAEGEIGLNWCDLHAVPKNASVDEISKVLAEL